MYGAGGDESTKTSFASGWNVVNGHWPVGVVGGEEMHQLTIAEMPRHNHSIFQVDPTINAGNGNSGWMAHIHPLSYEESTFSGGDQAHNTLPRFMVLAYIMKL